jgi:hypothetical protein
VQYKIQQEQPSTSFMATTTTASNEQSQSAALAQVNEFLKMKTPPKVAPKRQEILKMKVATAFIQINQKKFFFRKTRFSQII